MTSKRVKWSDYSDLELLEKLKKEIIRIGIDGYPSKTQYNKLYDRENCMSASSYLNRFNKTWEELIEMIGLEYDKTSVRKKIGAMGKGVKRDSYTSKWDLVSDDELYDAIYEEVFTKGNRTQQMYLDNRDKEKSPSLSYLKKRLGNWSVVVKHIKNKNGE